MCWGGRELVIRLAFGVGILGLGESLWVFVAMTCMWPESTETGLLQSSLESDGLESDCIINVAGIKPSLRSGTK